MAEVSCRNLWKKVGLVPHQFQNGLKVRLNRMYRKLFPKSIRHCCTLSPEDNNRTITGEGQLQTLFFKVNNTVCSKQFGTNGCPKSFSLFSRQAIINVPLFPSLWPTPQKIPSENPHGTSKTMYRDLKLSNFRVVSRVCNVAQL